MTSASSSGGTGKQNKSTEYACMYLPDILGESFV